MSKSRTSPHRGFTIVGLLIALIMFVPAAAAVSVPIIGSWEWGLNWGTFLAVVLVIGILGAVPLTGAFVKKIPGAKFIAAFGVLGVVVAALAASYVNPGGMLHGDVPGATASVAGSTATSAAAATAGFDSALYESTTDLTLTFNNYYTYGTSIAPAVKIFPSDDEVTEKAAFEGTARPIYSGTASSGSVTFNGIQVQTIGCYIDVYADLASYYQSMTRDLFICHDKNDNAVNDISPPTISLVPYGTLSMALSADTLTCSAGSQCTYSLRVQNTAADTTIQSVAVKFENVAATGATGTNATLDAVDSTSASICTLTEVSGTQYLVLADDIGPLDTITCVIKVTRLAGSADGEFKFTANDLFQELGATGWNANSNIRGASSAADATSDGKVDFA